jgi:hypothetical protein
MGSFAGMLKAAGYEVTGSDENVYPPMSDMLDAWGVTAMTPYSPANLDAARPDLVIIGNVIRRVNPEATAVRDWRRIAGLLGYFEQHPEWREFRPWGQLAVVQDPDSGALLSGGILDMMGARHTPVRPLPASRLTASALAGATMAVNVDGSALPPEKQEVLKGFARSGGTLLTPAPGPPPKPAGEATITLDKAEQDRIGDLWHDVQILVGRRKLGVRLFNVAGMLSNLLVSPDGKQVVLHLVNYSSYPVENITVQILGPFRHARLYTAEGAETALELYPVEGGVGVDIQRVSVCASLRLD